MSRLIKSLRANAYSQETYGLLNYYTLDIKDPEIRESQEKSRASSFDRLFKPMLVLVICQFIVRLLTWMYNRSNPKKESYIASVNQSAIFLVWILLWALLRCRWIKFAPLVVFFPPVVFGVIVNLQARQMLPDWLQDNTFRHGEEM